MQLNSEVSVLIVEDSDVARLVLRRLVEEDASLEIVGEASTGTAGVEMALTLRPRIVLMDIGLPEMDGIEATRQIKAALPEIRVLVVTGHEDCQEFWDVLAAGADGYCLKESSGEQLVMAIRSVCDGMVWIDDAMASCQSQKPTGTNGT